jgi:1,4-alpha-glucan branching enzyme
VYFNFEGFKQLLKKTSFPMVSRTSVGGLGFGMKWMMGWMHDTLEYFQKRYVYKVPSK